ncbi:esterase [Chlamydia pneumoniae TW-183]|uniref:Esterase n=2 Tax=Chlamydia pneumoniae TaxID=83558 RepID=Q9Z8R7_CHLPN|nr:alpha/beta hydrolase [Chlamydia pneumoniae]AAD18420.1 Lysophospholipase esterase [Chlamydia pneumoniae CWL029]AAF38318.1 serine esterase, putative [Chlamydia pneumoniae AR39]AAP98211.1 esterase [Chlamydia pneumoniae TW-183]CRI32771.1 Esterase [Chlamydia pneumoniae]CRI35634.1 Esterase [Chlamydia pneumoniae]
MTDYSFFRRKIGNIEAIECPGNPQDPIIILCHGYGSLADNLTFFPSICSFSKLRPTWIFPNGILPLENDFRGSRACFPLNVLLLQELSRLYANGVGNLQEKYDELFDVDLETPKEALEELILNLNRPYNEIIIGGFSQGAILATHLVLTSQNPYAGALIFAGARLFNQGWEEGLKQCAQVPFLQSHGYEDEILPYHLGAHLNDLLLTKLNGQFVSFHGGHEIPSVVFQKMQVTVPNWIDPARG